MRSCKDEEVEEEEQKTFEQNQDSLFLLDFLSVLRFQMDPKPDIQCHI